MTPADNTCQGLEQACTKQAVYQVADDTNRQILDLCEDCAEKLEIELSLGR